MRTLIKNGRVVDPALGCDAVLDVVIEDDRITQVGPSRETEASHVVDATGLVVLPGFIDAHSHSDFRLPLHPAAPARLHQGITTDVTGNCGFSPFPLSPEHGDFGAFIGDELPTRWRDLEAFARYVEDCGPAINVAPLVGLGSVRMFAMDLPGQPATSGELAAMRNLVESALEQGAFGVSSGLVYYPNYCLSMDETIQVLTPLAQAGRVYASHLRDERDGLVDSVTEALTVARRAGVRLQVSHHKALGRTNWGRTATTLAMMERVADETGRAVGVDFYPYTSGSTGISSLLPADVLEAGLSTFRERMKAVSFRTSIRDRIERTAQFRLEEITISTSMSRPEVSGLPLLEAAESQAIAPLDLLMDLVAVEGERITMLVAAASEEDLANVSSYRNSMHGSDAWLMTVDQARYEHPRNLYSTTQVLAPALAGLADLSHAVEQLATRPAAHFGIRDRGSLTPGGFADVVIVDPARAAGALGAVADMTSYPAVVRWVFVNGVPVLEDGAHNDRRPGRVLRAA